MPLKEAHDSGGWEWERSDKRTYFNDLGGLLPVSASANRSKGSRSPDEWMPTNEAHHCQYATDWLRVKVSWGLDFTEQEREKLWGVLLTCIWDGL